MNTNKQSLKGTVYEQCLLLCPKIGGTENGSIQNLSAYLRKMAIDGMIINLDISELKEISRLLGCNSRNINQIAKQLNSGSNGVYAADIAEIKDKHTKILELVKKVYLKLCKL